MFYKSVDAVFLLLLATNPAKLQSDLKVVYGVRSEFLNLSTIDLSGWIILYGGGLLSCAPWAV